MVSSPENLKYVTIILTDSNYLYKKQNRLWIKLQSVLFFVMVLLIEHIALWKLVAI